MVWKKGFVPIPIVLVAASSFLLVGAFLLIKVDFDPALPEHERGITRGFGELLKNFGPETTGTVESPMSAADQNQQAMQFSPTPAPIQKSTSLTPTPLPTLTSSPTPSPSPSVSPVPKTQKVYAIQPVIFLATDTNINASSYQAQVDSSFTAVRDWYRNQLGGKTFSLLPAIVYRSLLTSAQLHSTYGDGEGIWVEGLKQAANAYGLEVCDEGRFYYFVTPLDNIVGGFVGAEHLGCSHVLPGTASIPGHMGRLVGGIADPNWSEWWADEVREAQGGVAHELGHGLGGSCKIGNYPGGGCDGLPHPAPGQHSIIYEWWEFGTTGILLDGEKIQILKSPFVQF